MRVAGRINIKVNREAVAVAEGTYAEIAARYSVSEATVRRIKVEHAKRDDYELTLGGKPTPKQPTSMAYLNSLWYVTEQPEEEEELE